MINPVRQMLLARRQVSIAMSRKLPVLLVLFLSFTSAQAQSDPAQLNGYTASIYLGINHVEPYGFKSQILFPGEKGKSHFRKGRFIQLQLGREVHENWDIQWELEYQSNDLDYSRIADTTIPKTGNWHAYPTLVSVEFHPWTFSGFTPLAGVGAGISYVNVTEAVPSSQYFIDDSSFEFIWQLSAGISRKISANKSLELKYEYDAIELNHAQTSSVQSRDYKNHVIAIGFTYHFGS
jgi:opacity protein-like surface antigen